MSVEKLHKFLFMPLCPCATETPDRDALLHPPRNPLRRPDPPPDR